MPSWSHCSDSQRSPKKGAGQEHVLFCVAMSVIMHVPPLRHVQLVPVLVVIGISRVLV